MIRMRKFSIITQIFFLLFLAFSIHAAGEVDPTFNASTYINRNDDVRVVVAQQDGKMLVGGNFTVINGVARHGIARLNADGSLDMSFNPPDFYEDNAFQTPLGKFINTIALQSNGKILVGGRFHVIGSDYKNLVRLNTDGSLDNSFNKIYGQLASGIIDVKVFIDDTFLVRTSSQVVKYDANGFPAAGFSFTGISTVGFQDLAVLPDGKFYVGTRDVRRYNANGSLDGTFPVVSTDIAIHAIVIQPDGKILIGGFFSSVGGFPYGKIARLNADGTVDLSFNTNGVGADNRIQDIALAPNGKIFIGGLFLRYNGVAKSNLAKLNSDGTLDTSFTYTPPPPPFARVNEVFDVDILPNGKIAIVGALLGTTESPASIVVLNSDGTNDNTFLVRNGVQSIVREVVQQPDGKILIVGDFPIVNGVNRSLIARLNADGTLDTGFVPYFNIPYTFSPNQVAPAVAVQSDGKILIGANLGITVKRLNADGSQDTNFINSLHAESKIYDILIQPDGKILIGGDFAFITDGLNLKKGVARLNANGSRDTSFIAQPLAAPSDSGVYKVLLQPDGKVLVCGDFTQIGGATRGRIARLNADGTLDNSFNPPGGANHSIFDFDLQSDGKLVVGGTFTQVNGSNAQQRIGRLNSDGSLDTGFAQTVNNVNYQVSVNAVKIQPDGKILIGGLFSHVGTTTRSNIVRLNSNGSIDFTFTAAATSTVIDINLQADNKILLGGEFTEINNISRITVARLLNAAAPPKTLFDYDGDGRADVSVFRPSTNRWYVFKSSDSTVSENIFGIAGDLIVPADYDGDGKADLGIYRASSGDWGYLSSINNAQISVHWGASGDIPRPGDFDGDGKADYIFFRPSNNTWYRRGSTGQISETKFGLTGDKPVIGDFDGDRRSDIAIFRPSTGDWWWTSSFDNITRVTHWGISTDTPVAADYDGDGKTDFAVYRASEGNWYILGSNNGSFTIIKFGLAEDKPVPADYDGDGKSDIAVFRPSNGTWYLLQSTAGFAAQQFGISTDIPTPNAFIP